MTSGTALPAEITGIRSILEDNAYYDKCLASFMSRLINYTILPAEIIATIEPKVIQCVNPSTGTRTLKALGVGSGGGEVEDIFVSNFQPHFDGIHQSIVEPSKVMIDKHKKNVRQKNLKGVTYEWREESLEEFMTNPKDDENGSKFHFITAIHSLYYAKNLEESVTFLYDKLEENGILMIRLQAESGFVGRCQTIAPPQCNRFITATCGPLIDVLRAKGIPYDLYEYPYWMDLRGCLDKDPSEEARQVLDFLSHVRNFTTTTFPPELKHIKEEMFSTIREKIAEKPDVECGADAGDNIVIVQKKNIKT